ncbi:MAG TPA: HNH endonuclease signature motif containing protein [Usitatibacter sp.]|jgi:hypothetical protein|nr:HNH endonuclease signature motif containing protein [Usitatibacter sp.]
MADWVGYHKQYERAFGGEYFHTKRSRAVPGDYLYVILGHAPKNTTYSLAGKYRVVRSEDEGASFGGRDFDRKLALEPVLTANAPFPLDTLLGDEKEGFRRVYAGGIGIQPPSEDLRKLFDRLLKSNVHGDDAVVAQDIVSILEDASIPETTKEQLTQARVGQGRFRQSVIEVWGGEERCAFTGIAVRQLLVASHIAPWRQSVALRLDGTNGILLCAHLDKLFDQYLISFSDDGRLIKSKRLDTDEWRALQTIGVADGIQLNFTLMNFSNQDKVRKNLRAHRTALSDLDEGRNPGGNDAAVMVAA